MQLLTFMHFLQGIGRVFKGAVLQRKDELLLSEHFSEGLRVVRKRLPGAPLRVINFDWHGMVKDLQEKGAVEGLWALLETIVSQVRPVLCV
jgi:hypothetical protein